MSLTAQRAHVGALMATAAREGRCAHPHITHRPDGSIACVACPATFAGRQQWNTAISRAIDPSPTSPGVSP